MMRVLLLELELLPLAFHWRLPILFESELYYLVQHQYHHHLKLR